MTRVSLLEALKIETEEAVADLLLPVELQEDDQEQPEDRPAKVFLMRVPNSKHANKNAPYVLHQFITGADEQKPGELTSSTAVVRSIFVVYNEKDEGKGGLALLGLMERLRIHLLRKVVIDGKFELDKTAKVECLAYPDDTAPYYAGEMVTTWQLPAVEREVAKYL